MPVLRRQITLRSVSILMVGLASTVIGGGAEPARAETRPARTAYEVRAPGITVRLASDGTLAGLVIGGGAAERRVTGGTALAGCTARGNPTARPLPGGGVEFVRSWAETSGAGACWVVERFVPTPTSVRWEVEVRGDGAPWSAPIETRLVYPAAATGALVWLPWGDPRMGVGATSAADEAASKVTPADRLVPDARVSEHRRASSMYDTGTPWADPLLPRPFTDARLYYGAPPFRIEKPMLAFAPFEGDLFAIPLVSILEPKRDLGLSLILSPEDALLDLTLSLTADGGLAFSRLRHRISRETPVRFAADLVPHEADWRGGMRWMSARYPEYFDPPNPEADAMAGTGAYSLHEGEFDVAQMRRMAFRINWKASFDFPYMGMFLPPVADDRATWTGYGGRPTSVAGMEDYARRMKALGFFVLSYFNITEFGAHVVWPPPAGLAAAGADLWKDGNAFLFRNLSGAILHVPMGVKPEALAWYGKSKPGWPYYTWEDGIAMDCGDPAYEAFLLEQTRRHLDKLPDAAGFAIDRMDWLRLYNLERDDHLSWFDGQPAASLVSSWRGFMEKFGRMVHQAGKAIFVNNHDKRLDVLRQVDGIFDEHTYGASPLNLTAFLAVRKPALGWTSNEEDLRPDPDSFVQKYLYLGVYPMAPFPGNDHSIEPSAWADRQYLDYGPLLDVLRGKKWVLRPHVVEAVNGAAKVNLFAVPGGYAIPVTYAGPAAAVDVILRGLDDLTDHAAAEAIHPGRDGGVPVAMSRQGSVIRLHVPMVRGCAMVRIVRDQHISQHQ